MCVILSISTRNAVVGRNDCLRFKRSAIEHFEEFVRNYRIDDEENKQGVITGFCISFLDCELSPPHPVIYSNATPQSCWDHETLDQPGCVKATFQSRTLQCNEPMNGGDQPTLPAAELRNLAAISELLTEVPMMRRARLAEMLLARDYIPQLVSLFSMVEDLECKEDLHRLFNIFKGIVMLNSTNIYEVLLRDDMLMGCATASFLPLMSPHSCKTVAPPAAPHRELVA